MPQNHLTFVEFLKDGTAPVDGLNTANAVLLSPDGKFVYATGGGNDDAVTVFARDTQTGNLTFVETLKDTTAGAGNRLNGASGLAMSPDGTTVYVAGTDDNAISVFSRNAQTGRLTFVETIVDGTNLVAVSGIAVSSDGNFVYAVSGGSSDAITVFSRNGSNGKLTLVEALKNGTNGITNFDNPSRLVLSPDGNHVYVTTSNALAIFSRNSNDGKLTFVRTLRSGSNNITNMGSPTGVTISSDGNHVYVTAGGNSDAIVVFSRNSSTGELTFVESLKDTTMLDGAARVILSPDGSYVYVTSTDSDTIVVYSRNSTTGKLTFEQLLKDGEDGIDGLDGARGITVSADGKYIYATGSVDNAIAVLTTAPPPDVTAPTIILYTPDTNGTDVEPTSNLEIEFNEAVKKGSGNIVIKNSNGNVVETIDITSNAVTITDRTVKIDPVGFLPKGNTYYVEIDATAITDLAGNAFAGITGSSTWSFSTVAPDQSGPTIVELNPDPDTFNVPVGKNLIITFDEAIQKGTGKIYIKKEDGTVAEEIDVTSNLVTINNNIFTATINPANDLEENVFYYVEVDFGAFKDLDGNDFAVLPKMRYRL
ncbi:beta-propeller fold lactonase family protein [Leptolyngbya sp. 7M]|uniref:beta-propeller fold lactonase family protein n=1 Tax=Leptolyngbya sp. 7M TaxID=2812896 RepID=UPI001B8C05BF|nr:beta-propeller fold lactonase family protein [Leptolyngbya sp. 7M]QYO68082.1 beta-propeller fold lactonase family protein [Leptolyngbya sp. 7M]